MIATPAYASEGIAGLKPVDGSLRTMPLPGAMTSSPSPRMPPEGRRLCRTGRLLLGCCDHRVRTSGMQAWAVRMLAVHVGTFAALLASACDPTIIIGVLGSQSDAQGDAQSDAESDATVDAPGEAMGDAQGDATVGAQGDAQGDVQTCLTFGVDAGAPVDPDASVGAWTTSFEDTFCDYAPPIGFCYTAGPASYSLVTSPVHSGRYAAAFTVVGASDAGAGFGQARCVEQGIFPAAAYYGAWYYVPVQSVNSGTWNLFHFQGGAPGSTLSGLWDVSLVNMGTGGALHLVLYDFLNGMAPSAAPSIPIDQWFHIEVYFKRAKDATGTITLFQDGVMAANLTGLVTDPTDWGQWYVGNLADSLMPPSSTVYVDDVTVGFTQ
ncbi:MAG: hypothetical protein ACRENE_02420 [Polyangiaceae bacterium]